MAELDMRFTAEQWAEIQELLKNNGTGDVQRNALRSLATRWTDAQVPYEYGDYFSYSDMQEIQEGIDQWNTHSCVNIRPKTYSDLYYVSIVNSGGCSSYVGMVKIGQLLTLGLGCRVPGIVAHEFGHALGFHHEQTRPDRDNFVRIHEQNIHPLNILNFQKYSWEKINAYGVPYDYESVMHYGGRYFSINGQLTIQTLDPKYQNVIGNRVGISFLDVKLINVMYDCNKHCMIQPCPDDGFVGKDCKCWCKGTSITQPAVYCDTKEPIIGSKTNTGSSRKTLLKCFYCNAAAYWDERGIKTIDECNRHTVTVIGCEVCYKFKTVRSGIWREMLGCTSENYLPHLHTYFKGIFGDPNATMKVCRTDYCNSRSAGKPTTSMNAIFLALVSGIFLIFSA